MFEHLEEANWKAKEDPEAFQIYQKMRGVILRNWKKMNASEMLNVVKDFKISENLDKGIKREIRALYYLSKWRQKWSFTLSNAIDDLLGIDITAHMNKDDEKMLVNRVTFQVGGIKPDKKSLSVHVDYYIQVTENKIYIHKLV